MLGAYATAAVANESAMGFLLDYGRIFAEPIVGPSEVSAFRMTAANKGRLHGDDSYWDVDSAGCFYLHGDEYAEAFNFPRLPCGGKDANWRYRTGTRRVLLISGSRKPPLPQSHQPQDRVDLY